MLVSFRAFMLAEAGTPLVKVVREGGRKMWERGDPRVGRITRKPDISGVGDRGWQSGWRGTDKEPEKKPRSKVPREVR